MNNLLQLINQTMQRLANPILTRTAINLVSGLQIACKFSPSLAIESGSRLYFPNLTLCCTKIRSNQK